MAQDNNIVVAFSKEADAALADIEKKYNLEESDEEAIKTINSGGTLRISILAELIKKLASKEISQEVFISSVQKNLNKDQEATKRIFSDVSQNIIPFLKVGTREDIIKSITDQSSQESKPAQEEEKILPKQITPAQEIIPNNSLPPEKKSTLPQIEKPPTKRGRPQKNNIIKPAVTPPIEIMKQETSPKISKGPDRYREPIE